MTNLSIILENCYGINQLHKVFDFTQSKFKNIYAPNGFMKSSFAKVFLDLSKGNMPKDAIYPQRQAVCIVQDEQGYELEPTKIFVIESYSDTYTSEKISTLLVNETLKSEYDDIYHNLEEKKNELISLLHISSNLSSNKIESDFLNSQLNAGQTFFEVLEYIRRTLETLDVPQYENVNFNIVFNDKVKTFLETTGMRENLREYIEKYNSLIDSSQFLQRNFTHNHVATISTALSKNGFFSVQNRVGLRKNDGTYQDIHTEEEFSSLIQSEKQSILTNPELQTIFQKIDTALEKNVELRNFRTLIENRPELIVALYDMERFKQDLWKSYLKTNEEKVYEVLDYYSASKERLLEIIEQARQEETKWQNVVNTFNQKFNVPFQVVIENQTDVILNNQSPRIKFLYRSRGDEQHLDDQKLKSILSTGEKRALYILNLIFEIEARKQAGEETVLIIDDIADSFDYKNKYAIVEYLKEILQSNLFYMMVLTHNFDFFRTIASRLNIDRQHCFMTLKNDNEIKLIQAGYLKNVFTHWKGQINRNKAILIASIPFVRNLIEYTLGEDANEYLILTSLLHIKPDTASITHNQIQQIFSSILTNQTFTFGDMSAVVSTIFSEADRISGLAENNDLENKITLSIAIRLKAEEHMIAQINDMSFVNGITSNQTLELFNKYSELFSTATEALKVLGQVNLMTPENIHLNSFMYEPILDMSDRHLIQLYADVKNL